MPRPEFCWHGLAAVLHTGAGEAVKCSKCDKEWESRDHYFTDGATLQEQYQAHLAEHSVWREGAEL